MDGNFPFTHDMGNSAEAETGARSRDSLFLLAQLCLSEQSETFEVRVRNLSPGGMMAEHDGPVAIGEPLFVTLRGIGKVAGRVAWAAEGRIGIALDRPIDPRKARKPVATRSPKP